MPFTVRDFHDFVAILEKRPEWRAELRRLVLTDDILRLPEMVKDLVEAQRRTEEELRSLSSRVDSLAEAQRRTEEELRSLASKVDSLAAQMEALTARVDSLAAQMEALTARVDSLAAQMEALTARVDSLAEAQRRTEEELSVLTSRVDSLTQRVDSLAEAQRKTEETVRSLVVDVGELKGDSLERRYREKAAVYFGRLLRGLRVIPFEELREMLDEGVDQGKLTEDEAGEVMECDLVAKGLSREDGKEEHLLVEVSWGVGVGDVQRASKRAEILGKLGLEVRPVVAGRGITSEAEGLASRMGVGVVIDGKVRFRPGTSSS